MKAKNKVKNKTYGTILYRERKEKNNIETIMTHEKKKENRTTDFFYFPFSASFSSSFRHSLLFKAKNLFYHFFLHKIY